MTMRILVGDARERLRELSDESVHCVVTSPPYYGLRDYGVAGQIGLEPSPAEYVETLVAVFRDVHRVLRRDGTLWLNLGLSYVSGGMSPSRSRQPGHVPPCDTDGKEPRYSPAPDFFYPDPDGEHRDGFLSHHDRSVGTGSRLQQSALPLSLTDHDIARSDSAGEPPLLPGVPVSTTHALPPHGLAGPDPEATASARLTIDPTLPADVLGSAHTAARTSGTAQPASALRNRDKDVSGLACRCGSCGFCFIRLAMGALPFKPKDEMNLPHLVAMALQADGWFLRQTIVWSKPNPMPESVTDRCTKSHEYLFLLSKSARYYFDQTAIAEPLGATSVARLSQPGLPEQAGSTRVPGKTNGTMKALGVRRPAGNKTLKGKTAYEAGDDRLRTHAGLVDFAERERAKVEAGDLVGTRNRRSVWEVTTQPFSEAHFATFPPALVEPCILAGCPKGGTVLDPFFGAGTTGIVADRLGRDCIGIELNPAYAEMTRARLVDDAGMFANVEVAA